MTGWRSTVVCMVQTTDILLDISSVECLCDDGMRAIVHYDAADWHLLVVERFVCLLQREAHPAMMLDSIFLLQLTRHASSNKQYATT